jgi:cytochrome P450
VNKTHPEDLLSTLIAGHDLTPKQQTLLRDQVMTFLLAGHETTANALLWSFYYLSQRPEIWRKIQAEVDQVLAGHAPTMYDLRELKYTRQVFDEVLRFHPIVWTMSRDALTDDQIPLENGNDVSVPKGTTIMMCTYAVHRRERYWENPEAFDPDRFEPETARKRPQFAYFPFGGGPRQCLGIRFAIVESVIALAMMAQRYRLELLPGQSIAPLPNITLRPNGKVFFKLVPRVRDQKLEPATAPVDESVEPAPGKCPFPHAA